MRVLLAIVLVASLLSLAGCGASDASQADLDRRGAAFLLAEEPAPAVSVLDFRESGRPAGEVALLGRIGGGKDAWSPTSAEFLIFDPTHDPAAGNEHVCADGNCPFCKNKQEPTDAVAIVMLTGADGSVPAVDARKLLPLEENQLVVVRGQAEINAIGQLVVRASGVYIRR
jgi:hypothetical protein